MRCVLAPSVVVLVVLLAACGKQPADNLADAAQKAVAAVKGA